MIAETTCSDRARFWKAWAQEPMLVASVTPSSQSLARLITQELSSDTGSVMELGPGTGVFTKHIIERGVAEKDVLLVERDIEFSDALRRCFPSATVCNIDASKLARGPALEMRYGATVSGLPLLSMSPRKVLSVLTSSFHLMRRDGKFYQFTYGPSCPVPRRILDRLELKAVRIGWTPLNFPPAAVYRISRRRKSPMNTAVE
jgi:phosphatidylethanolamine/phosphatidyl-N-methylethanolamine N-methyltransferase